MADKRIASVAQSNIRSVAQIEKELLRQQSTMDRISERIVGFTSSIYFIIAHVIWFTVWVIGNALLLVRGPFDPYPFAFLNLLMGMESVFLTTFVLMNQNHQNRQADHWAHLNLQISMLAEQEATKMLQILQTISDKLGLKSAAGDHELKEMVEETHVDLLVKHLGEAREPRDAGSS
ncbi:MAG: DUF1003 domain-containing protein [Gemmataceae bacterium]